MVGDLPSASQGLLFMVLNLWIIPHVIQRSMSGTGDQTQVDHKQGELLCTLHV